jgi:hypothetical protein
VAVGATLALGLEHAFVVGRAHKKLAGAGVIEALAILVSLALGEVKDKGAPR